ncbi:bile acid:sodium symporter [Actinomycetaceae bacterium TAE3-ERU4]|nr:bile acid:sodium symporter [Actinomycetaceae bacterium TAE3-ERU4]
MKSIIKKINASVDYYILLLLLVLSVGILIPLPSQLVTIISFAAKAAVVLLFFLYGARLPTNEVIDGLKNWKVQTLVFIATFFLFPLFGLASHKLLIPILGSDFALGFLFLTLLPSTIQSSVTFTSIAHGNVPAAVCAATVSNLSGMFITPFLAGIFLNQSGVTFSFHTITGVLFQLLLPFVCGQLLQSYIGQTIRKYPQVTSLTDRTTIVLIVASAVASATAAGLWDSVSFYNVVALLLSSAFLLLTMLLLTWWSASLGGLSYQDKVVVLMCGSKKSLTSGLPIATVLFSPALTAAVTIPVLIFHQFQLVVCAIIAQYLGKKHHS